MSEFTRPNFAQATLHPQDFVTDHRSHPKFPQNADSVCNSILSGLLSSLVWRSNACVTVGSVELLRELIRCPAGGGSCTQRHRDRL